MQALGINAVFFQIRPECDALYESALEPWSYWLTGAQGTPPIPYYDPLEFAIQETHKRGMELHAWLNPYRAVRNTQAYNVDEEHVTVEQPDWVLTFGTLKILNPGLPQVRDYVTSVVADVVRRYDIDGIHFDDYFYPYPPDQIRNEDQKTFNENNRGFTNIGDWRRDNVNLLVSMVHSVIQDNKPYVKFGISPFGIWKNGVPPGITGLDAYNVIYADPLAWVEQQTVDYLAPQLYWPFGGGQDYGKLLPWWNDEKSDRHLYVGQGAYRIQSWRANELPRQLRLNRDQEVKGSIFFKATDLMANRRGFADSLRQTFYRYPALPPIMDWKDMIPTPAPENLRYELLADNVSYGLRWDAPTVETGQDSAIRYAVYRLDSETLADTTLQLASNLDMIAGLPVAKPGHQPESSGSVYFSVTALDRNNNESPPSNVVRVEAPVVPVMAPLAYIVEDDEGGVQFGWEPSGFAGFYQVQIALDSLFENIVTQQTLDSLTLVQFNLKGQSDYFWRIRAANAAGYSEFSRTDAFTVAFPAQPEILLPVGANTPLVPGFSWQETAGAEIYRLQVATNGSFDETSLIYDIEGLTDTTYTPSDTLLAGNTLYFWRVRAFNETGPSDWSADFRFRTLDVTAVVANETMPNRFHVYDNYPNPFNPTTTIEFDLDRQQHVMLAIYNIVGQKVALLVDEPLQPGHHSIRFDASDYSSGVYLYRVMAGNRIVTKRMLFLK